MRKVLSFALLLAAAVALPPLPADAVVVGETSKTVETFAATCVMEVALPGQVVNGAVEYAVSGHLKGMTFDAGPVQFDNRSIDLSGTEAALLEQRFRGTATIPLGAETVSIQASGASDDLAGQFTVTGVRLGEKFSPTYLDVASNTHQASGKIGTWSKSLTSALDGYAVSYGGTYTIVGLDAVNGVADGSGSGSVTAAKQPAPSPTPGTAQNAAAAGLGLVLAGTGGLGLLRRRRPVRDAG